MPPPLRFEGSIRSWNDERGFGFIAPSQGGDDVFVHVSAIRARGSRPLLNQRVSFEVERRPDGKKRACRVMCVTSEAARTPVKGRSRRRPSTTSWGGASLRRRQVRCALRRLAHTRKHAAAAGIAGRLARGPVGAAVAAAQVDQAIVSPCVLADGDRQCSGICVAEFAMDRRLEHAAMTQMPQGRNFG
jgi:cold shock CspA family protein